MSKQQDEFLPIRSKLAVALLKVGLALAAVWVVALLAFAARDVLVPL